MNQFWPVSGDSTQFVITVGASNAHKIGLAFCREKNQRGLIIAYTQYYFAQSNFKLSQQTTARQLGDFIRTKLEDDQAAPETHEKGRQTVQGEIRRSRSFLEFVIQQTEQPAGTQPFWLPAFLSPRSYDFDEIVKRVMDVIHLPGLRGNPERMYPVTAVGQTYPGTFESYAASLIDHWSSESPETLKGLGDDLKTLGLTWKIDAKRVADTHVELHVGRMPRPKKGGASDLVSIADVGFGVSQTLPVVVALRAARPGQLVYAEQPEIHLHPRAQVAMARLLVNAAKRGVRVVAETHSSLILLALQTLIAEGAITPDLVGLNWFVRNGKNGTTRIETAELDSAGRFGDWPEDFDEVALKTETAYLSAAEARLARS